MKIRNLIAPVALALCTAAVASAQSAPKAPATKAPKAAPTLLRGAHFSTHGAVIVDLRKAPRSGKPTGGGDMTVYGKLGLPALLQSPSLRISAQKIVLTQSSALLRFSSGGQFVGAKQTGPRAKVKLTLTPRSGGAPITVEAECYGGSIVPGKITLEDTVSGFYEDASGRHELKGDIVSLSAFDNAISIVQDGDITLS